MIISLWNIFQIASAVSSAPFACGHVENSIRPYGKVELRVDCSFLRDSTDNNISVLEFKGKRQHGIAIHYDSLWRKRDSSFYKNGKEEGNVIFWDTLGNVIGRESFRNGIQIGKRESYFAPGRPALIKHYNSSGKAHGPWSVWWKNGNKKSEFMARNGIIVSGTEYYQDGSPRVKFLAKYEPGNKNVLKSKYIDCEAWGPNGKPAGKITKGNGDWLLFPDGSDSTDHEVFREVYKDSLMTKLDKLDSADFRKWLLP